MSGCPAKQESAHFAYFFFFQYLFLTVINSRLKVCSHIVWTLFVLAILCRTSSQCLSAAPPPTPPFKPKTLLDAGQPFPHLPTNPGPFPCLLFLFIPLSAPPLLPHCVMKWHWGCLVSDMSLWSGWLPAEFARTFNFIFCQDVNDFSS